MAEPQVAAKFQIASNGDIHFKLGNYDHSRSLIIDPVFTFSTYLDGSKQDTPTAVTTDAAGNVYVTGYTLSTDFPVTNINSPLCPVCPGDGTRDEGFISKLDPTGHSLLFSTYLGGSSMGGGFGTFPSGIALDLNGNIIVGGTSSSWDFPVAGAVHAVSPTNYNVDYLFLSSLKPDGSAFNYSGLVVGQSSVSSVNHPRLAVDSLGNAYLSGLTDDPNFQLTPGTLDSTPTGYPNLLAYLSKLSSTGQLIYSTLIPGNAMPSVSSPRANLFTPAGISVDTNGQVTIAGIGGLGLPSTAGALLPTLPTAQNMPDPTQGFLLQLNAAASAVTFATYVPGVDQLNALSMDPSSSIFIAGYTSESTFAPTANAFQKTVTPTNGCVCGGFVMKLAPQAQSILAATYTAPSAYMSGIAVDSHGNVLVGGNLANPSSSSSFPLKNPLVSSLESSIDNPGTVIAEFSPDLSTLLFGTYLASSEFSSTTTFSALAVDASDRPVVAGTTQTANFPTTPLAFQRTPPGMPPSSGSHTFVTKIDLSTPAPSVCLMPSEVDFGAVQVSTSSTMSLAIANCGNAALQISSIVSSLPSVTVNNTCPSIATGSSCTVQVAFTPTDTNPVLATLTIHDNAAVPTSVVDVSGMGGTPTIFLPDSFNLNDAVLGTQVESSLLIENDGDVPYILTSVTATGDFTATPGSCTAPVQQTFACNVEVIFAPSATGLRTGTLAITDNAPGSPHVVNLSGNGLSFYTSPSITSIPAEYAGQTPALRVYGYNFFPTSQIMVNGTPRTTYFIRETLLTAALTAADTAQAGELSVTVTNPGPVGGVSNTATATIYTAIRDVTFAHTVYDPNSKHLYATVSTQSTKYPGQVVVVDPQTASVIANWTVGNGPNQLAVSDDGALLYVGLDGDKTVAQLALPAGTVNFAVGLGPNLDNQQPLAAGSLKVFPGHAHSWAVSLCAIGFGPCGNGIAVYDDAVRRPTFASGNQLEPDFLTFVGQNLLFGLPVDIGPPSLYKFSIDANGITLAQTGDFGSVAVGTGGLDSDGTLLYVNNGEIIDPATLVISPNALATLVNSAFRVDTANSRVFFSGDHSTQPCCEPDGLIQAFDLSSHNLIAGLTVYEHLQSLTEMNRWGTNGLVLGPSPLLFFLTSLTNGTPGASAFTASFLQPATTQAGSPDLSLVISGTGFAQGDTVHLNGTVLQISALTATQITTTVPAGLLTTLGDLQINVSDTANHTVYLALQVTGAPSTVSLAPNALTFAGQALSTTSAAQTVRLTNTGATAITVSNVAITGDFAQTNNCATVMPASTCSILITFTPTAGGDRTGLLTVTDNDVTGTQSVALDGTGASLQIAPPSGSSVSSTVTAGDSATYQLSITPQGGFTDQITFSCTSLPQYASCSINPATATISSSTVNVTVTISTQQTQSAALIQHSSETVAAPLAAIALFLILPLGRAHRRRWRLALSAATLFVALLTASGCGGGSKTATPVTNTLKTAAGTYTINFVVKGAKTNASIPLTLVVK